MNQEIKKVVIKGTDNWARIFTVGEESEFGVVTSIVDFDKVPASRVSGIGILVGEQLVATFKSTVIESYYV